MTIRCPQCESSDVRESYAHNLLEQAGRLLGFYQLRCRRCDRRFTRGIIDLANIFYARCPRCYRLDLTRWSLTHYHVPTLWKVMLSLGAKPHRCEACRVNFVGFRRAKMKYQRPAPA